MIYVTVGTHDQPFSRLVKAMDEVAAELGERVVIQLGPDTYMPRHAEHVSFVSREEADAYIHEARLVVSHGGCGIVSTAIKLGKPLVVVPRRRQYGEHIDDHQVELARALDGREGIRVVYDERSLRSAMDFNTSPTANPLRERLFDTVRRYLDEVIHQKMQRKRWPAAMLFGILILALGLRLWGIGWGLPNGQTRAVSYHPDENTYLHLIATANPRELDFVIESWGQAIVPYALAAILGITDAIGWFELQPSEDFYIAHPEEAAKIYLMGRAVSLISGILSIVLIYLIVRKTFPRASWRSASLGALCLAVAPGDVINCHYLETDVPVTFFVLLTVYLMANLVEKGRVRDYLMVGISAGLAIGTKWSALPLLPLLLVAHCMRQPMWWRPVVIIGKGQLKSLLGLGVSLILTFLVTNPYVALNPIVSAGGTALMAGSFFVDVGIGSFLARLAKLFFVTMPTSLGWGICLLGYAGALVALFDRRRTVMESLSLLWIFLFSLVATNTRMITVGRMLPLAPLFVVLAVSAVVRLCRWADRSRVKLGAAALWIALSVCLALASSVLADLFFCSDTARQDASRWIAENIPPGASFGFYDQEPYWDDPDILYQDFYHPPGTGARYQYEIYPLKLGSSPQPKTDYLIFTHRDTEKVETDLAPEQTVALSRWMEDQYEEVATFESTVQVLGLEIKGWHHRFFSPRIQILRLKQVE